MNIQTENSTRNADVRAYTDIVRDVREAVRDTIYKASLLLDNQKWDEWLALCDEEFTYDIKSWSPEIHYDMTYLYASRKDLVNMTQMLVKHNSDHSPLTRHTTVYNIEVEDDGSSATAVSSFVILQHLLDGTNSHIDAGESRLFLVGKYYDSLQVRNGAASFLKREVRLDNRRLDKGSHWPL